MEIKIEGQTNMNFYIKDNKIYKVPIKIVTEKEVVQKIKQEDGTEKEVRRIIESVNYTNKQSVILDAGYKIYTPKKVQIDIKRLRFNKRKIKNKLVQLGYWNLIKQMLTEDEYQDLILSEDFAFDDELFVKCYEMLKTKIENIDDILKQCRK